MRVGREELVSGNINFGIGRRPCSKGSRRVWRVIWSFKVGVVVGEEESGGVSVILRRWRGRVEWRGGEGK